MSKPKVKGITGLLQSQKAHKFKDTSFLWCERNESEFETREFNNPIPPPPNPPLPITFPNDEEELKAKLELSWSKLGAKLQQKKSLN